MRKIQGSDSKVFGTAFDPNPVADKGRGRPTACQDFVRVVNVYYVMLWALGPTALLV